MLKHTRETSFHFPSLAKAMNLRESFHPALEAHGDLSDRQSVDWAAASGGERRETPKEFIIRHWEVIRLSRDAYFRLERSLSRRGFAVLTASKADEHNIWDVTLRAGGIFNWRERKVIQRLVAKSLRELGLRCPPREIEVIPGSGDRVKVSFIWSAGTPGYRNFCDRAHPALRIGIP